MLPLSIPTNAVVKNTAKTIMKRSPVATTIISLIILAVFFLTQLLFTGMLSWIFNESIILQITFCVVFFVGLFWPVFMGAIRFFWVFTEHKTSKIEAIFYYFSNFRVYLRAVKTVVLLGVKIFLISFLALIPYFISHLLQGTWIYNTFDFNVPLWSANLKLITDFLKFAGIALSALLSLKYYLYPVVVVMDERLYLMEAMHISEMISKQSVSAFASLVVSFLGWLFFSLLGLPLVYTLPYFLISYVVHCRFAIVNYNLNLQRVSG